MKVGGMEKNDLEGYHFRLTKFGTHLLERGNELITMGLGTSLSPTGRKDASVSCPLG